MIASLFFMFLIALGVGLGQVLALLAINWIKEEWGVDLLPVRVWTVIANVHKEKPKSGPIEDRNDLAIHSRKTGKVIRYMKPEEKAARSRSAKKLKRKGGHFA